MSIAPETEGSHRAIGRLLTEEEVERYLIDRTSGGPELSGGSIENKQVDRSTGGKIQVDSFEGFGRAEVSRRIARKIEPKTLSNRRNAKGFD